jgi:hypothetical protein
MNYESHVIAAMEGCRYEIYQNKEITKKLLDHPWHCTIHCVYHVQYNRGQRFGELKLLRAVAKIVGVGGTDAVPIDDSRTSSI